MKEIFGWSGPCADAASIIAAMAGALPDAKTQLARSGAVGGSGSIASRDGVTAVVSGLNRHAEEAASSLLGAYLEMGDDVFRSVRGAFSAAILDDRDGSLLLAIDRTGTGVMSYGQFGTSLVFGSSLDGLLRHPEAKCRISRQAVYDYVYFHMVPGPETIYEGCKRLLPGEYLVFRDGKVRTAKYWEMHFDEHHRAPFGELKKEFLDTLRNSVREASFGANTGAFLSGGTDSSTISGMLGEVLGSPAKTYSIGFDAEGYDEMEYARIAAKRFGTDHHEYYVTPDDVAMAIPKIAAAYDQPFGNSSAVPTYFCAKLAREDGIERLLGGDGGDELFGGNSRYASQRIFSIYGRIPSLLRSGIIEPIAYGLPSALMPVRKLRSYIGQARTPMPARLETYNLLERLGATEVFTSDFLEGLDRGNPVRLLNDVYHGAHAETMLNRMLALDLKFTLADNDLPKVTRTCQLAGVDIAYPMLSDEVVAFSARLDPELKLKGTRLRYFFKEALRGFLPDEILTKSKHGFGLPFGEWMKHDGKLQEIGRESLESLGKRNIIRPGFADSLFRLHAESHSGYYGTMVWVLMMLEQWFRHHQE